MKVVQKDGQVFAKLISEGDWKEGLSFYSDDDNFIQVGTWRYDSGKLLLAHVHNEVKRTVLKTQEVLYIRKGKLEATIYDLSNRIIETLTVTEGEVLVLLNGGHGYKILEDGTQVLEIKNGPYLGPEIDRRRINKE